MKVSIFFTVTTTLLLFILQSDLHAQLPKTPEGDVFLGRLSSNEYDSQSISNPYSVYGSPYGPGVNNPFSKYGSEFSNKSWCNPFATDLPKVYAADGTYLGKLYLNELDPESILNTFGRYGNPYGNNLMNEFSKYGSPYSSMSWTNPYAHNSPLIIDDRDTTSGIGLSRQPVGTSLYYSAGPSPGGVYIAPNPVASGSVDPEVADKVKQSRPDESSLTWSVDIPAEVSE